MFCSLSFLAFFRFRGGGWETEVLSCANKLTIMTEAIADKKSFFTADDFTVYGVNLGQNFK
jgi:hypothetical protein